MPCVCVTEILKPGLMKAVCRSTHVRQWSVLTARRWMCAWAINSCTFRGHTAAFIDLSGPKDEVSAALDRVMSDEIVLDESEAFYLHPGELALAVTLESVTLPADLVGWLDGRSSLARLGLMVHVTAHRIDPGWSGCIVLEFCNSGKLPLALRPGMLIGALSFEPLSGPAARPYNRREDAKYRNQQGAVASRIDKD